MSNLRDAAQAALNAWDKDKGLYFAMIDLRNAIEENLKSEIIDKAANAVYSEPEQSSPVGLRALAADKAPKYKAPADDGLLHDSVHIDSGKVRPAKVTRVAADKAQTKRKSPQEIAETIDNYFSAAIKIDRYLAGTLSAKPETAADKAQDAQPVAFGDNELSLAWGYLRSWFGIKDWTVADAANFRIMFEHGYRAGAARASNHPAAAQPVWVGLTREERLSAVQGTQGWVEVSLVIEAALKAKNAKLVDQESYLASEYRKELDVLSQRNYELRMENAALKAKNERPMRELSNEEIDLVGWPTECLTMPQKLRIFARAIIAAAKGKE